MNAQRHDSPRLIERHDLGPGQEPMEEDIGRDVAYALDRAGAPRKIGTLSLGLVERIESLVSDPQLAGAVDALEDFIAEVAAPTGRLRLAKDPEGAVLHDAVKRARATLNTLRGRYPAGFRKERNDA